MPSYLLHAVGPDMPGIVAGVTHVLEELGCNLGESRMTILHEQFAIMLALDAPEGIEVSAIEEALMDVARSFDLLVAVRRIKESSAGIVPPRTMAVSIHGADRPGIVALFATEIASAHGNIVDLATRVVREQSGDTYIMLLTIAVADEHDHDLLTQALERTASTLGVRCVIHADEDIL